MCTYQIEQDTNEVVTTIPQLKGECGKLMEIFAKINNLEKFVGIVKQHVNEVDDHISAAELDFTMVRPVVVVVGAAVDNMHMSTQGAFL